MSDIVLKRGLRSSDEWWQDEIYDVLADGKVVGRIYEEGSAHGPPELRWAWSITAIVPATAAPSRCFRLADRLNQKDTWPS